MNHSPGRYYKASGRIALTAPLRLLWPGALPTVVLALIYTCVIRYNPFIYFSCIATVLFGVGIALIASMATEAGQSRSLYFDFLATLVLALFALWIHWLSWIMLTLDGGANLARHLALAGPGTRGEAFQDMSRQYHLVVSRRLFSHGAETSSANMLWLWGAEASLITATALVCCKWLGAERVYCERSGKWSKPDLQAEFVDIGVSPEEMGLALEQGNYGVMDGLAPLLPEKFRSQARWKSLELKLGSAPATSSSCFISICAVDNTWDRNGKRKQEKKPVVRNLLVPDQIYQALLARLRSVIASKDKKVVVALPQIAAHQKYGAELAARFADWLTANPHFYFSHRDATCMGFELTPDGGVLYRRYDDGQSWSEPEKHFATLEEFAQWLAQQSDRILAANAKSLTNPVTFQRIQRALAGQGRPGDY